jgi:putative transposase
VTGNSDVTRLGKGFRRRESCHGISPAPKRKQTVSWKDFVRSHRDVLVGMNFFTTEVLTLKGLTAYYVLFFVHLEARQVKLVGFTPYPDQEWMEQQARNMTMEEWGSLRDCRYLLHDRDAKFCPSFRELISRRWGSRSATYIKDAGISQTPPA